MGEWIRFEYATHTYAHYIGDISERNLSIYYAYRTMVATHIEEFVIGVLAEQMALDISESNPLNLRIKLSSIK